MVAMVMQDGTWQVIVHQEIAHFKYLQSETPIASAGDQTCQYLKFIYLRKVTNYHTFRPMTKQLTKANTN